MVSGALAESLLLLLVAGAGPVCAAQVSLSAQPASPGSSVVLTVNFAAQSDAVAGIQFDLGYDSSVMSVAATAGGALRGSSKLLYTADIGAGQKRFLIVGLNQTLLQDGALLNLFINVQPSAAAATVPLTLSNLVACNPAGQTLTLAGADGSLLVSAGPAVPLQAAGVMSAASTAAGAVAPGELLALVGAGIGPNPGQQPPVPGATTAGGTSVLFDNAPAPLLYAGPNQINAVVPFGTAGKTSTVLQVMSAGQVLATVPLQVTAVAPAIFTLDSSGVGQGSILNQDLTVNGPDTPASQGSVVALYATGAGQTNPPGVDGQLAANPLSTPVAQPVAVQIGGQNAPVQYAGAAPGMIAGIIQVNCVVPQGISGAAVPVLLTIGNATSPAGVTMAVQ